MKEIECYEISPRAQLEHKMSWDINFEMEVILMELLCCLIFCFVGLHVTYLCLHVRNEEVVALCSRRGLLRSS